MSALLHPTLLRSFPFSLRVSSRTVIEGILVAIQVSLNSSYRIADDLIDIGDHDLQVVGIEPVLEFSNVCP